MIKLINLLKEALNKQEIVNIANEFIKSNSYNKSHDCKRSTFEFIKWVKKNKGFEPDALLLAPPKDIKKFPGKSGDGDSHIFSIVDGFGIDFTANQFPGVSEPLKITPESQISSEYKKIGGYYTLFPDWFPEEANGGKSSLKAKFNSLPQWFRDGLEKEGFKPELTEGASDEAWELVGQKDPNISKIVKDAGYKYDEESVSKLTPIIEKTPITNISPSQILKLKNFNHKPGQESLINDIVNISKSKDPKQGYIDLMAKRDKKDDNRQRGYDIGNLYDQVVKGNYESPVLIEIKGVLYVIGGRTRLYAGLASNKNINVKIIKISQLKETPDPQSGKSAPYGSGYAPFKKIKK
jgi:hypothetical protein